MGSRILNLCPLACVASIFLDLNHLLILLFIELLIEKYDYFLGPKENKNTFLGKDGKLSSNAE